MKTQLSQIVSVCARCRENKLTLQPYGRQTNHVVRAPALPHTRTQEHHASETHPVRSERRRDDRMASVGYTRGFKDRSILRGVYVHSKAAHGGTL